MNRRDFIGSIIGTLLASRLPFIAEVPKLLQLSAYDQQRMLERLWDYSISDLLQMKGFYVSENGEIKATPIQRVVRTEDSIGFESEDLNMHQALTFEKMGLILPDNRELVHAPMTNHGTICMIPGDTLHGSYYVKRDNLNKSTMKSNHISWWKIKVDYDLSMQSPSETT